MSDTASKALKRQILDPLFRQHVTERSLQVAACSVALNFLMFIVILWQWHRPVEVHYFYTDQFGHPRELIATNKRLYNDAEINNWAVSRATFLYTMNFKDVDHHLDEARLDFNVGGWNSWFTRFRQRGNIDLIKNYRAYVSAVPRAAPTILEEKPDAQGRLYWKVRFPLLVKWENNQPNPVTDIYLVTMTIRETNNPLYKAGLVITQLDAPMLENAAAQ